MGAVAMVDVYILHSESLEFPDWTLIFFKSIYLETDRDGIVSRVLCGRGRVFAG